MSKEPITLSTEVITIEAATADDFEQWLPLWKNYQLFYGVDIAEKVTRLVWQRFHNPIEPIFCAVAKENGRVVGLVHYLFHRSTWSENNYCYLEDLYVSEEMRGKLIGKRLIEFVQKQARKHHSGHVYWHTHETNFRGQRLYNWIASKSGMIEYRMQVR